MSCPLIRYSLLPAVLVIGLQSCTKDDNPVESTIPERGEIIRSHSLGTTTVAGIRQILAGENITIPFTLYYSVETISVEYHTEDGKGNGILVSGALLIPRGAVLMPMVSIQHGTETKDDRVASVSPLNSTEGVVGLVMASMGYLAVVPDYPGFGISNVIHPYLHAESLIPCVVDIVRAGRAYCSANYLSLNGEVFLVGYSEGGYVTLVTQKAIEEHHSTEFNLRAVAPLSGPYDLYGTVQTIMQSGSYTSPAYIAFFLTAYNEIYGWNRLNDFFNMPYASRMPGSFDGSKTWSEVVQQLPSTFSILMNPIFVSNYVVGNEQNVLAAVRENTRLSWKPAAPIHFFHGDADDIVPIQNALTAVNAFTSVGATNVSLTTITGGTHETSGPAALIGAIEWFESMETR